MSSVVETKPPKDPRVEAAISHWAPRFVINGVPLTDFQEVTAGIDCWEDWCSAWSARAAVHEDLGDKARAAGYKLSAGEHYTRAAVCYHFGKFLFVNDLAQMKAAHLKAVACRNKALPLLDPPGERVAIPYEGRELYGNLRKPAGVAKAPIVVMCMGLDSAKEEMDDYENRFLQRGLATLAFDGPGQGEAEYDFAICPEYERPVKAVIDYLEKRPDVDAKKIGIVAISLGGYYSPRCAAMEPRYAACIAWGAQWNYYETWKKRIDAQFKTSLSVPGHHIMWILGVDSLDAALKKLEPFKLDGVMQKMHCPFLLVHGADDEQIPLADAQKQFDACGSKDKTFRVYTAEEGGAQHCQRDYLTLVVAEMWNWFEEKLVRA